MSDTAAATHPATHPRIYAHRGGALLAPENTRSAFDLGLSFCADVLETDVRISADQQLIVIHDETLERTTDGVGRVRDWTLSDLQRLDAGYHCVNVHGENFRGAGVKLLTLDELFALYPNTPINIDIKDNDVHAAALVAQCLRRCQRETDSVVGSFHKKALRSFRQHAPLVKTAALQLEVARLYLQHLTKLESQFIQPYVSVQIPTSYKMIQLDTERFIRFVHDKNIEICFWTINDPQIIRELLLKGADGIITDRPDLAFQIITELGIK